jgi:hypothetical protein
MRELTPSEAVEQLGLTSLVAKNLQGHEHVGIDATITDLRLRGEISMEQYQQYFYSVKPHFGFNFENSLFRIQEPKPLSERNISY